MYVFIYKYKYVYIYKYICMCMYMYIWNLLEVFPYQIRKIRNFVSFPLFYLSLLQPNDNCQETPQFFFAVEQEATGSRLNESLVLLSSILCNKQPACLVLDKGRCHVIMTQLQVKSQINSFLVPFIALSPWPNQVFG